MFQSNSSRPKGGRRRDRQRPRLPLSFQRISGSLQRLSDPLEALSPFKIHLLLHDLTLDGVGIFCPETLLADQPVVLQLEAPLPLKIKAVVRWCQEHGTTHRVLSSSAYAYRAGLQFQFSTDPSEAEKEKNQLLELLKLIPTPLQR